MDAITAELFSDTEIDEHSFIDHLDQLSSLDNEFTSQSIWECFQEALSTESNTCSFSCLESAMSPASIEEPEKSAVATAKGWNTSCIAPGILSFGNMSPPREQTQSYKNADGGLEPMHVVRAEIMAGTFMHGLNKRARSRPPTLNQDHVIAERKRREKITENFFALSAIIPGLKKRDKASILMDAIKYMKQMEQKVKTLEDQAATAKKMMESEVAVEQSKPSIAISSIGLDVSDGMPFEIEARLSEKTVLIRIHCQDCKGMLVKVVTEIENLHLSVINTCSIPFPDHFLDITVTAQVQEGCPVTVKDILKKLNLAFRRFM